MIGGKLVSRQGEAELQKEGVGAGGFSIRGKGDMRQRGTSPFPGRGRRSGRENWFTNKWRN